MTLVVLLWSSLACAADGEPPPPPQTPPAPPKAAPADPRPDDRHFRVDPIADGAFIGVGLGWAGISELILSTGEIRPQQPSDSSRLLGIDHGAISQHIDPNASMRSNLILYAAVGFAVLDPLLSGVRDGWDAARSMP